MRKADFRLPPQARRRRKGRKRKRMGTEKGSDGQPAGEVKRSKLLSSILKGTASTPLPPTPPPRTPPPHVRQQRRKKSKSIRKTLLTKTGEEDYAIVLGLWRLRMSDRGRPASPASANHSCEWFAFVEDKTPTIFP